MTATRVLVTGGTGFIGSALVKGLVRRGYAVRVLDNDFRGRAHRLAAVAGDVELISADIRDEDAVLRATEGMEAVYHLAFINGTRFFYEMPDLVLDVGVRGALSTLKAALACGVGRYVLASSSEVYQTPERVPTDETERLLIPDPQNPRYSYAGGKLISELLTINALRGKDTAGIIFRPHNIFGPDMGFEHVIPELVKKLHATSSGFTAKAAALPIQGTGEETRAFCYIDGAVDQIVLCGEKGVPGEIYHVGEPVEMSIRDLAQAIGRACGIEVTTVPGPAPAGGTPRRCPDTSKVRALGYATPVPFTQGLAATVSWYANHFAQAS